MTLQHFTMAPRDCTWLYYTLLGFNTLATIAIFDSTDSIYTSHYDST